MGCLVFNKIPFPSGQKKLRKADTNEPNLLEQQISASQLCSRLRPISHVFEKQTTAKNRPKLGFFDFSTVQISNFGILNYKTLFKTIISNFGFATAKNRELGNKAHLLQILFGLIDTSYISKLHPSVWLHLKPSCKKSSNALVNDRQMKKKLNNSFPSIVCLLHN